MSIISFQVTHPPHRETCPCILSVTNLGQIRRLCTMPGTLMFLLLFSCLYIPPAIAGFSFSWSNPTECDQLNVSWQGGSGPYHLLALVPVGNRPFLEARTSI